MKRIILLSLICVALAQDYYTVYFKDDKFSLAKGKDPKGAAFGKFENSASSIGWDQLWVHTTPSFNDSIKAMSVGFLEGALTADQIWDYWRNINQLLTGEMGVSKDVVKKVYAFLESQQKWTDEMVHKNPGNSYWAQVGLIQDQVRGMSIGYNSACGKGKEMREIDLVMLNSFPDSLDLVSVVAEEARIDWFNLPKEKAVRMFLERTHCSSLTKISDKGELMTGHSTWIFFSMLNRIFKHKNLVFDKNPVKAPKVSMSSYPGQIASADDFYQLDSDLVVMETSNSIFNASLYSAVHPNSLLSWQRTTLANRLADGGKSWAAIFAKYNSGTYNNQWIVVDFKRFKSNQKNDVLWIVEQIPGQVASADKSDILFNQSYWPSYNIPYFKEIYELSGYGQMAQKYGDAFVYNACPRANIFRRNETMVQEMGDMRKIMRYNNFQHDPLSMGAGDGAICARMDLTPNNPSPFGCTDSKITNWERLNAGQVETTCGPTHDQQIPFSWSNWQSWPHRGMPDTFDFGWVTLSNQM